MAYKFLTYEERKRSDLTLNRPEKRNALGQEFEEEIISCIQDAGKRCDAKVIILKAAGNIFCAGHDRLEILNQPPLGHKASLSDLFQSDDGYPLCSSVHYCPGTGYCHGRRMSLGGRLRSHYGR